VRVFDNSRLGEPHRQIAELHRGRLVQRSEPLPGWFAGCLARAGVSPLPEATGNNR